MTDKFQNKYRIPTTRLNNWDYASNAGYFVTICTKNRECYFGTILDKPMVVETPNLGVSTDNLGVSSDKIHLSNIGIIARNYWYEIPLHFPFVELGEFVVMPNHVHGIIIINKINGLSPILKTSNIVETPKLGVSTAKTVKHTDVASQKWNPGTLGVIINQYKRIVTINARKILADFAWQSRFYDHIIRNDESFQLISNYIKNNPDNPTDEIYY